MNQLPKKILKRMLFLVPVLFLAMTVSGQDAAYEKAMKEIKQEFGIVPAFFKTYPKIALSGAWESFKQLNGPQSLIPAKYRELLQLAVAAQIPCEYCVYFHSAAAKAHGASEAEIYEAVAQGAQTRHWSMILQGNQIDFEVFKAEFNSMMEYMAQKSSKQ